MLTVPVHTLLIHKCLNTLERWTQGFKKKELQKEKSLNDQLSIEKFNTEEINETTKRLKTTKQPWPDKVVPEFNKHLGTNAKTSF